ncbi:MAG TPA: pectin acetylesterase-family hydrolase [Candidatus Dormibacteraeota bacterium]|nr:pectin acetylesterase-family hydrolase [Candidatus Dormibacteraeota bacterium]
MLLAVLLLAACGDDNDNGTRPTVTPTTAAATLTATPASTATAAPTDTLPPTATATALPTVTATPQPTATVTSTRTPSLVDELIATGIGKYLGDDTPSETVPNGAWDSLRFDPADAKAICLRGDPYQVEIHRGSNDKVLLYLEGGGACWNNDSCWVTPTAKLTADPSFGAGIFELDNPANPFKDWNIVYAPYCDGSVFGGDNLALYDSRPTYHHGVQNLSAAVTAMRAAFPDPSQIVVAGSSAGGYGTYTGYGVTRVAFPDTPIVTLNDSGPGLQNPDDTAAINDRLSNWRFQQFVPPSCTRCGEQLTYLTEWGLERDPDLRVGYFSNLRDVIIRTFNGLSADAYEALLRQVTDDIHGRQPERFKRFFVQGESHTILELPGFYTLAIGDTRIDEWTADLLDDGPRWRDLVEGVADLSVEISGGNGPFIGAATPARLDEAGYVEHEYVASGTATSYTAIAPLTGDGQWTFGPDGSAPYRTRILVRYPANPADFSGTVVVEWLNVSGGVDANPDYASLEEELTRQGHAWVGVSAQLIGVEGGPVLVAAPGAEDLAGKGLKKIDPARYGSLVHPGDGYSFDIFTQVARALRQGGVAMGGLQPQRLLAAGESQSALALVTYYNGVQPLTHAFDGFFVHSRASLSLPLVGPGQYADLVGGLATIPAVFRSDLAAPVVDLQAETDVTGILKSVVVRQADSDTLRLWEVAGTAHADVHLLGPIANALACGTPINNGPLHLVAKAAFRGLDAWVRSGEAPPAAPRLDVTSADPPEIRRDGDGIALGGIRTPPVDVPVAVLSGVPGPNPDLLCLLLGSTTPLPAARLAELYASRADYDQRYAAAADAVIAAGFVLAADRDALLAFADPSAIAP